MDSSKDGGPAFPFEWRNTGDYNASAPNGEVVPPCRYVNLPGMTLRDYFAAAALQGILANQVDEIGTGSDMANLAYQMADIMLAERSKC